MSDAFNTSGSEVGSETSKRLPFPPVVLSITGASGSGKTTLAVELARALGGLHFSLDHYYRDLSHLPVTERKLVNFDDPAMIEAPLLEAHIRELAQGHAIELPGYSFGEYIRVPEEAVKVEPGAAVVVEGLFALYYPELRPLYQLSVYVDTPDDICFERRLRRDVEERSRTPESVRRQYEDTVRPCGLAFVRPLEDFADLVIDGTDPLDFKVEQVMNALRKRGLLSLLAK